LRKIEHEMIHQGIRHVTIQLENEEHPHDESDICAATEHDHSH